MLFKVICNISDLLELPYTGWSKKTGLPSRIADGPAHLIDLKIQARTTAANSLREKYDLPEIDSIPDPIDIERWSITNPSVVNKIADYLGFVKPSGRVQVLPPGAMVPFHLDNLGPGYLFNSEDTYQNNDFTQEEYDKFAADPACVQRVLIMLDDCKPGQLMVFENDVCSGWKKGDVIHWSWQNTVHATINAGCWSRPLLRVSGFATEKFFDLIK